MTADSDTEAAQPGAETGPCVDGECLGDLMCLSDICVDPGGTTSGTTQTSGSSTATTETSSSGTGASTTGTSTTDNPTTTTAGATTAGTTEPTTTDATASTVTTDVTSSTTVGENCMQHDVPAAHATVLLAVEKSGYINYDKWDHDNDPNTAKVEIWTGVYKSLSTKLSAFDDAIALGLSLYPSKAATNFGLGSCISNDAPEVPPAVGNAAAIIAELPFNKMTGAEPMSHGIKSALAGLANAPELPGRAIVVVGHLAANCVDNLSYPAATDTYDAAVHTLVSNAFLNDGIPTYIIGAGVSNLTTPTKEDYIPDSTNAYDKFNQLATDGGRPRAGVTKFYDTHNEQELLNALQETLSDAQGCRLILDTKPIDPAATEVTVGDYTYPYNAGLNCDSGDGWVYVDGTYVAIQMCGDGCMALKSAQVATVATDC